MLSYPPSMSIINHWREQADSLQDAAVQHRTESAEPRTQTAEQRTSKTGQRTGGVHNNTADQRTESSGHATDPRGASNNNYGNLVIYIYYISLLSAKKNTFHKGMKPSNVMKCSNSIRFISLLHKTY